MVVSGWRDFALQPIQLSQGNRCWDATRAHKAGASSKAARRTTSPAPRNPSRMQALGAGQDAGRGRAARRELGVEQVERHVGDGLLNQGAGGRRRLICHAAGLARPMRAGLLNPEEREAATSKMPPPATGPAAWLPPAAEQSSHRRSRDCSGVVRRTVGIRDDTIAAIATAGGRRAGSVAIDRIRDRQARSTICPLPLPFARAATLGQATGCSTATICDSSTD